MSDAPNKTYIEIAKILFAKVRRVPLDTHIDKWKQAIEWAKDLQVLNKQNQIHQEISIQYPKEFSQGTAAKRISSLGCRIEFENGEIEIKDDFESIEREINTFLKRWGGIPFIRRIFTHLVKSGLYDKNLERYLVTFTGSHDPYNYATAIPFGYWLNLAAKFPSEIPITTKNLNLFNNDCGRLQSLLTDLFTITGCQQNSIWGAALVSLESLPEYLAKSALYDVSFAFPQGNLNDEIKDLPYLFNWVEETTFSVRYGYSIKEYCQVATCISNIVANQNGPVNIYESDISRKLKHSVAQPKVKSILKDMAHRTDAVNEGFSRINDQHLVNFFLHPLVQLTDTKYILYDKNWCANAFYECLVQLVGPLYAKETDAKIGNALEELVDILFKEKGIETFRGNFSSGMISGESDIIVADDETIIIIEIKKTQLSRKGQSGADFYLFLDLGDTVLKAQEQAGKIELLLKNKGFVDFTDSNGNVKRLHWNNRKIERIALTHYDYHSFHDRIFVDRFLSLLLDASISINNGTNIDTSATNRLKKLNKTAKKLTEQYFDIPRSENEKDRPYFDCWFISLPILKLLLTGAGNVTDFLANLRKTKHISLGTKNFYKEYSLMRATHV